MQRWLGCTLVLLLVGAGMGAEAARSQSAAPGAPFLFVHADREVAQVGSPLTVQVELLATVVPAEEQAWRDAFAAVQPFAAPWEVLREEPVTTRVEDVAGGRVLELARRFVVRVNEVGAMQTQAMTVQIGARRVEAAPLAMQVYALDQAFYTVRRNVLPLVATSRDRTLRRSGSGFLVADDALVTAYHVVVGTDRVRVTLPDGRTITTGDAWVLDPARDVAILRVDPNRTRAAGAAPLRVQDEAIPEDEAQVTLTAGWRDGRQHTTEARRYTDLHPGQRLRVSANPVGPGDSGGPLLNTDGEVLGVVVSGRSTRGDDDLLQQDLCLTTDLRPAMAALATREAPRPLRASLALLEASAPHAQMLRAVGALYAGHARGRSRSEARPVLADLLDAATRTQDDPAMLFLLATTLDFVGDRAAAAEAYAGALEHADGFFPAAYALGHYHLRNGQFGEAEAYFSRTALHPGYRYLAALGLARSHTERFDYPAAIEELQPVLHRNPDFAPALYLLAYAHLGLGDEATAESLLVRLQHLDRYWAERLALNLRTRALRPTALHAISGL